MQECIKRGERAQNREKWKRLTKEITMKSRQRKDKIR